MGNRAVLLGIDIGATSVKTGAFSENGALLASESEPNGPKPQEGGAPEWRVWDLEAMWESICRCAGKTIQQLGAGREVRGVAVTGFGADGVPMGRGGRPLYPCISWHCGRTVPQSKALNSLIPPRELYALTGYHNYPINTFNRFLWLRDNEPKVLDEAVCWLHVQDYIVYRLTGEFSTERTIASTAMALDLRKRDWAGPLFGRAGLPTSFLGPLRESGTAVGPVSPEAAGQSGIPAGAVVATGGHDTEMAILGAGINRKDIFLDINGTWEILMAITDRCDPTGVEFEAGLDWECHALPGWWNYQALMLAGGVIEWVRNLFYRGEEDAYAAMMREAAGSPPGCNGVAVIPALVRGMGPAQAHDPAGCILGFDTQTGRSDIARATFEAVTYQFYQQIHAIEASMGSKAQSIRVTGGGQKNPLWMQMKADMAGRAIEVLQFADSSMLGAAILAGVGAGVYGSVDEALSGIEFPRETVEPDMELHQRYAERYERVISKLPERMEGAFQLLHGDA